MLLTDQQIASANVLVNESQKGRRPSTYDATVGHIIVDGKPIKEPEYLLPPRGIAWIVSNEEFHLPCNLTGLATLRTTWTNQGVLALNVGIIDPGWQGPIATALVNFSEEDFSITKSEGFLRVLFLKHLETETDGNKQETEYYLGRVRERSRRTGSTFLNIQSLGTEIVDQVLGVPRVVSKFVTWGSIIAFIALVATLLGILFPIAYGVTSEWATKKSDVERLKAEVAALREQSSQLKAAVDGIQTTPRLPHPPPSPGTAPTSSRTGRPPSAL